MHASPSALGPCQPPRAPPGMCTAASNIPKPLYRKEGERTSHPACRRFAAVVFGDMEGRGLAVEERLLPLRRGLGKRGHCRWREVAFRALGYLLESWLLTALDPTGRKYLGLNGRLAADFPGMTASDWP